LSEAVQKPRKTPSIRQLAERKLAGGSAVALDHLTPDEIRRVVHELEVHQVELEIQNQQLEEAQREAELSRSRYQHLYESAPIGYLTLDSDGSIVSANLCAAELLKVPRSRLLGRKLSTFVASAHQDRWHFARRALIESGERRSLELALVLDDGTNLEIGLTASRQLDSHETVNLGILDMTDLRNSERALRKAASAASLAEQHERRKLAAELHDDAGQLISLASIKLRLLAGATGGDRERKVAELSDLLTQARIRITSLSFQMSPPLLHDVGLMSATRWLAEDLERSYGLLVTVVESPEIALDEVTRSTLFQAIRELLINVKKHASVDTARVQVWKEGAMVRVAVEDGGTGFDSDLHRENLGRPDGRGGFGLLALRERLAQLGGTLSVGTGFDGAGTRVVVSLPLTPIQGDLR
jgi:PAS domain S-box-containing protein